jgi:hypothetical protein
MWGRDVKDRNSAIGYLDFQMIWNISGGNQLLCANYENFNLSHTILIQGKIYGRWEG